VKSRYSVRQKDITDCGAACLASVAAYYRLYIPVSRIRQYAGTDKQGTNIAGLIEAAERLSFNAKGVRGVADSLSKIPLPAILHIVIEKRWNHYVVIYKITKKNVVFMDPALGRFCKEKKEDFIKKWSGVIVLLIPKDHFKKGTEKISILQRFWRLINPHRYMMLQAFIGAVVYTLIGLSASFYVQKIIDFVLTDRNFRLLNLMSAIMIVLLIFQFIIGYFKSFIALKTGQYIDSRLAMGYYRHVLRLPKSFFDTMRVGEIISRVNDAIKIRVFINDIALNILVSILIVFFSILLMFLYYWKLGLIIFIMTPIYMIIYWISNKVNKKWQRKMMENAASLETQMVESINAADTIKRFGLENYFGNKTESNFLELLKTVYKSNIRSLFVTNVCDFLTHFFTILMLWTGSYFVMRHEISPGELFSFYTLMGYFTSPVFSIISANKNLQDALIAADRLFEIIDLETEEDDDEKKFELTAVLMGDIRFNEVYFRYGTRGPVFSGLNLVIKKNAITAIIGESGSGKSTLISLLQNLYPVNKGNIRIGEIDIRHISNQSLRQMISIVPQRIDLFSGTVIDNIAAGEVRPDMQRILFLSHLLGIKDFVEKLPEGYNTLLNEQASNISGGQRQRLAIARALYKNPEVLMLDEATSSLDSLSEQKVQEALIWFKNQNKTIIVIAHRLSTIQESDTIIVLKDGMVLEQGSHTELLRKNSGYAQLLNNYSV